MGYGEGFADLAPQSDTLAPLTDSHRNGLIAVSVFGMLSFLMSSGLFLYLTYKLVTWHLGKPRQPGTALEHDHDMALDMPEGQARRSKSGNTGQTSVALRAASSRKRQTNQFLVLFYNLLIADMHQSLAFLLNISWVSSNGITVGSSTCWAQGWFVSIGDLASSAFISFIAVHTYLVVVRNYKPPQRVLYAAIVGVWAFDYLLAIIGVAATDNGKSVGGFYVRATAWCWMNSQYDNLRLWLHYFWIFVSLALTTGLYSLIPLALSRSLKAQRLARSGSRHHRQGSNSLQANGATSDNVTNHHPAFLIYPLIYVICTAPLAIGRIVTMAGKPVSVEYFCLAGAMIASNGWLDVVLFSTTRHALIFDSDPDAEDAGLDTFTFIRTPHNRKYGNMVWVQGASRGVGAEGQGGEPTRPKGGKGWWKLGGAGGHVGEGNNESGWPRGQGSTSQESLRSGGAAAGTVDNSNAIQMDTVTSVVVEVDPESKLPASSVDSIDRMDKGYESSTAGRSFR